MICRKSFFNCQFFGSKLKRLAFVRVFDVKSKFRLLFTVRSFFVFRIISQFFIGNTVIQNVSFVLMRKTDKCDKTNSNFCVKLQYLPIFCTVKQIATSCHN